MNVLFHGLGILFILFCVLMCLFPWVFIVLDQRKEGE